MVAQLITFHIFPQLVSWIPDTPVRKNNMWIILGFVGEKKFANQIFRSILLSAAWMLSPISSMAQNLLKVLVSSSRASLTVRILFLRYEIEKGLRAV